MEEVMSKVVRRRGTDAGQSRRRWVKTCSWCPQALQEESDVLIAKANNFVNLNIFLSRFFWRQQKIKALLRSRM